jgi:hypothetical protein
MTQPVPPEMPQPKPETAQLSLALVETPAGQRLALTLTMLLPPGDAKALAKGLTDVAAHMSAAGLVVAAANGHVNGAAHG